MNQKNQNIPIKSENCDFSSLKAVCANCNLRELCIPGGISGDELDRLDNLVSTRKKVKRGESLFRNGQTFQSLYAVRLGFFKTSLGSHDGREQITGFQLPGELLGFDGVSTDTHSVDAVALEDSEVCVLPYGQLEKIAAQFAPLQHQIHKVMSREIVREQGVLMLLGSMRADERIAAFLLNLAERYKQLGYASNEFLLRMTRQEIGGYLGLKIETVSRAFSTLQKRELIEVDGKKIVLRDNIALRQLISNQC